MSLFFEEKTKPYGTVYGTTRKPRVGVIIGAILLALFIIGSCQGPAHSAPLNGRAVGQVTKVVAH